MTKISQFIFLFDRNACKNDARKIVEFFVVFTNHKILFSHFFSLSFFRHVRIFLFAMFKVDNDFNFQMKRKLRINAFSRLEQVSK